MTTSHGGHWPHGGKTAPVWSVIMKSWTTRDFKKGAFKVTLCNYCAVVEWGEFLWGYFQTQRISKKNQLVSELNEKFDENIWKKKQKTQRLIYTSSSYEETSSFIWSCLSWHLNEKPIVSLFAPFLVATNPLRESSGLLAAKCSTWFAR